MSADLEIFSDSDLRQLHQEAEKALALALRTVEALPEAEWPAARVLWINGLRRKIATYKSELEKRVTARGDVHPGAQMHVTVTETTPRPNEEKPRSSNIAGVARHAANPPAEALGLRIEIMQPTEDTFELGNRTYLIRIQRENTTVAHYHRLTIDWNKSLVRQLFGLSEGNCSDLDRQKFGAKLRGLLSVAGWEKYEAQLNEATRNSLPVHIDIITTVGEMVTIPWELLVVQPSGEHLGELQNVCFRYSWPSTQTVPRALTREPRMLMAWSAAGGPVPASAHEQALHNACAAGNFAFERSRDVVSNVSLDRLADALHSPRPDEHAITVLHLVCHGASDGAGFGLMMDTDQQVPALISPSRLRAILKPHAPQLRLVVLCACFSSNVGDIDNELGSLSQALHRIGIQWVIGSRTPLSRSGSVIFAGLFFKCLCAQESVENAFMTARAQLAARSLYADWASLQLLARPGESEHPLT